MIEKLFTAFRRHQELARQINQQCDIVTFKEGDVLLKEGGYARFIPLVLDGLVKVYKEDDEGNEVLLYYINAGQSCIMSATYCMQNQKSEVKAIVEESARVVLVPADLAAQFSKKYSGWNEFLFELFNDKYSELLKIIQILTFENKDKRLLDYLRNEQRVKGSSTINVTHKQIANDLGASREVVSRLLKKLENEGHLKLEHRKIVLR